MTAEAKRRCRVLIVDDHPVMREGLDLLVSGEPDLEVCGSAGSVQGALEAVPRTCPEVVVLDLTLGKEDGIAVLQALRMNHPDIRVLVLSMHEESLYAERLLAMGAHGYVMKQEPPEIFLGALRKVVAGEHFVSAALGSRLFSRLAKLREVAPLQHDGDRLTVREHDVLRAVARGLGTREMADALGISAKTVDSHRRNIREKLGLSSAGELVRYAVKWAGEKGK